MSAPLRILFVCTANICRSPFLELSARQRLDSPAVAFASAGTRGYVDHPMSDEMSVEAARHGLDVAAFRSRPLTRELLDESDLVLTVERHHRQYILDDHAHAFRKVLTLGQAVRAASSMPPAEDADALLAQWARHRGMAEPADDIADPFRRGAEAQTAAARQMSAMLDALIPVLAPLHPASSRKSTHG